MSAFDNDGKLLQQVRRIGGRFANIEEAIEWEHSSLYVLRGIMTARGSLDNLLLDAVAGYIRLNLQNAELDEPECLRRAATIFNLVEMSLR